MMYIIRIRHKQKDVLLAVLFSVAVFGLWHPAPHGEQAVHHESRGVCLCHSQHLPRYHLHLLLLPPNLRNKTRVKTLPSWPTDKGCTSMKNINRHVKSLLNFGDCVDSASNWNSFIFCLILTRSQILCESLVQIQVYIDVQYVSIHTQDVCNLSLLSSMFGNPYHVVGLAY